MKEIEGICTNDEIRLFEAPEGIAAGTRVIVRFLYLDETDEAEAEPESEAEEWCLKLVW